RGAERAQPADWLRVPHPLPACPRRLPQHPAVSARERWPDGALPFSACLTIFLEPKGGTAMTLEWRTDRRTLLKAGGAALSGLALAPRFAWAADGDTLRIRMEGDLQVLDPAFMIGGIEETIMRAIYVSLVRLGDLRDGAPWSPWGAEK